MKRKLQIILSLCMIVVTVLSLLPANAAEDVKENSWFYSAVNYVMDQGYMQGVSTSQFAPLEKITRGMLATVLYRLDGSEKHYDTATFSDNIKGKWYFDGVEYCARQGIVLGYGNGKFGVNDAITRQDMMTMICRYAAGQMEDLRVLDQFNDSDSISRYARESVAWCVERGVVSGTSYNAISPKGKANRAQLSQILMNFDECVRGADVNDYRADLSNPYGLAVHQVRLKGQEAYGFTLSGLAAVGECDMSVEYLSNGEVYGRETVHISADREKYEYSEDTLAWFKHSSRDIGRTMSLTARITVSKDGQTIFEKKTYMGEYFCSAGETPLYYKGQKAMDCRILLYHEFSQNAPSAENYGVISTPKRFEKNIQDVLNAGYTIIPLDALIEYNAGRRALPQKSVIITLDDGYLSNYTMIYPLLQKYDIPATIFVTVSTMNKGSKMTWAQMREMENSRLVDIQSHSWEHIDHSVLDAAHLSDYIGESFEVLEKNLGQQQYRIFAYPYGKYSTLSLSVAQKAGISMQMSTDWRALNMAELDLSCLPRLTVAYDSNISSLLKVTY